MTPLDWGLVVVYCLLVLALGFWAQSKGAGQDTNNYFLSGRNLPWWIAGASMAASAFSVDTHIHRLAARWGLSSGKNVVHTERDLKRVFAPENWGRVHLQIIYFGREHCPARSHDLSTCPICSWASTKTRIAAEKPRARAAR